MSAAAEANVITITVDDHQNVVAALRGGRGVPFFSYQNQIQTTTVVAKPEIPQSNDPSKWFLFCFRGVF